MKKSLLAIALICTMVLGLFGGSLTVHAAPTEVFTDDFSEASLSGKYTVVNDTASVVDGKLVIDSTGTDFGGALITAQKVDSFVLEFDLNNACEGANTFSVITGIQDRTALTLQDWTNSSVGFGSVDSTIVNNSAGAWQRYSWFNIPVGADVRVRITVDTGVFSVEYKTADGDWTAIVDHYDGAVTLQPTSGYLALAINGAGKVTIDNISLTAEYAPEDPLPTEPETTEPETTEPEATEPEATEPEATEPEATVPAGEFYWEDNFDGRTELGDMWLPNLGANGSVSIVDGKLKFDKIDDATGIFLKTQAMGNKFTVSFDLNMQDGSGNVAFLFGIDAPETPAVYWDSTVNRFSMGMATYTYNELPYTPGSGTDTDPAAANIQCWWRPHCSPATKAEDEYVNVRLVFDVVDGENIVTVYYKLNTDPDSELEVARAVWKGVDAAGYIGIVSQGHLTANFTIDNLVITDRMEAEEEDGDKIPATADVFDVALPAALMVMSLVAIVVLPNSRRRNAK